MRASLACAVLSGLALAFAGLASCADDGDPTPPGGPGPGSGGGAPYDGGTSDAEGGGGSGSDAGDAEVTPVLIGITPSPRNDQGPPTAGDLLEAELATFAVGVRGVVVTRALRELDSGAYAALAQQGDFYEAHGKRVLMNLALVDRAADERPAPLDALAWDDPNVIDAVHAAIDGLLTSFGGELAYLTFGRDVDVYLAGHPGQRNAFEHLAEEACAYAADHGSGPRGLQVGVGFSFAGASSPDPSFNALLDASDAAVLSYLPGLAEGAAEPTSTIAASLDSMAALARGKPVVLAAVGYPSSIAAGGSEEKQQLFFQTFFDALGPRRSAFAFVNVAELHDPAPAACDAYAASQGADPGGVFASFACTLGLFDQGAAAKPAWIDVAAGAAAFAAP